MSLIEYFGYSRGGRKISPGYSKDGYNAFKKIVFMPTVINSLADASIQNSETVNKAKFENHIQLSETWKLLLIDLE